MDYLIAYGFAQGSYENKCLDCGEQFLGAKRSTSCEECASDKYEEDQLLTN